MAIGPASLGISFKFVLIGRFVTGVIAHEGAAGFERLLWRACRGNVFLRTVAIEDRLKVRFRISFFNVL